MRLTSIQKVFLFLILVFGYSSLRPQAQDSTITISLAIPQSGIDQMEQLIKKFEEANSNIKVQVVGLDDNPVYSPASFKLDSHLTAVEQLVSSADVVYVSSRFPSPLSPEATKAGYFLDLEPFVSADNTLSPNDFYPAVWDSLAWDKHRWALPVGVNTNLLAYNPSAFDKAGLAYPDSSWTLTELTNAIQKLATKDASGKVTQGGIDLFSDGEQGLFISLMRKGVFNSSILPNPPQFTDPALEILLDTWAALDKQGFISRTADIAALNVRDIYTLSNARFSKQNLVGTLLPGGKAHLIVYGFAVSGGTAYPEQAYQLTKFLTTQLLGYFPARKDIQDQNGTQFPLPPDLETLLKHAIEQGIPVSDMRYTEYLFSAISNMLYEGQDAKTTLRMIQDRAIKAQQQAEEKKKTNVVVATIVPSIALEPGTIALRFGLSSVFKPLPPNLKAAWDKAIQKFTETDPVVKQITLVDTFPGDRQPVETDCSYAFSIQLPSGDGTALNLDPLMDADSTLNKSDFIGGVLKQVERDGKLWAFPVNIEPAVLHYNVDKFRQASVPEPQNGWTTNEFIEALRALKAENTPVFSRGSGLRGGLQILLLVYAFGGMPIDHTANPAKVNFLEPATVDAIRQVLDLAKAGYIEYSTPTDSCCRAIPGELLPPIYPDLLRVAYFGKISSSTSYKTTLYPKGSGYQPIAFSVGTASISADSQNPEACYRWIKAISEDMSLFSGMPARRSILEMPALAALQGSDAVAFYTQVADLLEKPETAPLPVWDHLNSNPELWLFEAFSRYVEDGDDLQTALEDAQSNHNMFAACLKKADFQPSADQEGAAKYTRCFEEVNSGSKR